MFLDLLSNVVGFSLILMLLKVKCLWPGGALPEIGIIVLPLLAQYRRKWTFRRLIGITPRT